MACPMPDAYRRRSVNISPYLCICLFTLSMGFSWQVYWSGVSFPPLVSSKGNQLWFIERTDAKAKAEAPKLWPPDAKS